MYENKYIFIKRPSKKHQSILAFLNQLADIGFNEQIMNYNDIHPPFLLPAMQLGS